MNIELLVVPAIFGAAGYLLYSIKDFLFNCIFVSLKIEELGSFMETTVMVLKNQVLNQKWAIGRFSMVHISTEEIKKDREMDNCCLDAGIYFGIYKDKYIIVTIDDKTSISMWDYMPRHPVITIIAFRWNSWIFKDLLSKIKEEERPIDLFATGFECQKIRGRQRHGFEGLFLPHEMENEIKDLVLWFISPKGEQWYRKMKQPYKLVLLFYGIPGTGKTAIAKAIADITRRSLIHMKLISSKENKDISHEIACMSVDCKNDILLYDEIDKLFLEENKEVSKIDPATLLQILNGDFLDGHILILTLNDLDRIPESFRNSLIRSRRVDRKFELGMATRDQKERACAFYGIKYSKRINRLTTMADVIEHLMNKVSKKDKIKN